jgi:hypothetical protein
VLVQHIALARLLPFEGSLMLLPSFNCSADKGQDEELVKKVVKTISTKEVSKTQTIIPPKTGSLEELPRGVKKF